MSKSIYERAREILLNMGTEFISIPCNPIGEENSDMIHLRDVTETYETNMHEVVKALEQAQKKEKLLGLYRQLVLDLGLVIEYDTTDDWSGPVDYEYLEINDNGLESLKTYKKIKELEK